MNNWHIMFPDGRTVGPVTTEQVRYEVAAGQVPPGTTACQVGATQWVPVTTIAEFGPPSASFDTSGGSPREAGYLQGVTPNPGPGWNQQQSPPPAPSDWPKSVERVQTRPTNTLLKAGIASAVAIALLTAVGVAVLFSRPATGRFCSTTNREDDCYDFNPWTMKAAWHSPDGSVSRVHIDQRSSTRFVYQGRKLIELVFVDRRTFVVYVAGRKDETYELQ